MGSGGALIVTILTRMPLWATLLMFAAYGVAICAFVWSRATRLERAQILVRVRTGCFAGILATAAYDGVRLALVKAAALSYWPFETFVLFGRSIAGAGLTRGNAYAVGLAYHCINGTLFAIAYAFILGERHWLCGIAFALALEVTVLLLYPGWIDLSTVKEEFTAVSLIGHTAYGVVLGLLCSRRLRAAGHSRGFADAPEPPR